MSFGDIRRIHSVENITVHSVCSFFQERENENGNFSNTATYVAAA